MTRTRAISAGMIVFIGSLLAGCGRGPDTLGLMVNDPTGLTYRHKVDSKNTWNVALGLNSFEAEVAHGHIDYMIYFDRMSRRSWNPYWGLGVDYAAKIDDTVDDNVGFGLRVPLGVSYEGSEMNIFAQLAGRIMGDGAAFTWALGVRFGL